MAWDGAWLRNGAPVARHSRLARPSPANARDPAASSIASLDASSTRAASTSFRSAAASNQARYSRTVLRLTPSPFATARALSPSRGRRNISRTSSTSHLLPAIEPSLASVRRETYPAGVTRPPCSRWPIRVFTMPDLGVHERRSWCSRSPDPAVHDAPILAFTIGRNPHHVRRRQPLDRDRVTRERHARNLSDLQEVRRKRFGVPVNRHAKSLCGSRGNHLRLGPGPARGQAASGRSVPAVPLSWRHSRRE